MRGGALFEAVRSQHEIQQRIDQWRLTKGQFYPDSYFMTIFGFFISRLAQALEGRVPEPTIDEEFWRQLGRIGARIEPNKKYVTRRWNQEFGWLKGEGERGALSRVAWDLLLFELHDAECTFRKDGSDLVLEGSGDPPDFARRGRTFRFWLRLKNGQLRDERSSTLPIELVWILYHDQDRDEFLFTAQDNTLSGILTFWGDDYEFRLWDHRVP